MCLHRRRCRAFALLLLITYCIVFKSEIDAEINFWSTGLQPVLPSSPNATSIILAASVKCADEFHNCINSQRCVVLFQRELKALDGRPTSSLQPKRRPTSTNAVAQTLFDELLVCIDKIPTPPVEPQRLFSVGSDRHISPTDFGSTSYTQWLMRLTEWKSNKLAWAAIALCCACLPLPFLVFCISEQFTG